MQIHIAITEKVYKNMWREYVKMFRFLGVEEVKRKDLLFRTYHTDPAKTQKTETLTSQMYRKENKRLRDKLEDIFESHNERLYKFLGRRVKEWERLKYDE